MEFTKPTSSKEHRIRLRYIIQTQAFIQVLQDKPSNTGRVDICAEKCRYGDPQWLQHIAVDFTLVRNSAMGAKALSGTILTQNLQLPPIIIEPARYNLLQKA